LTQVSERPVIIWPFTLIAEFGGHDIDACCPLFAQA